MGISKEKLLERECIRLEKERNDLYYKLEQIKKYKDEYETLIGELKALKKKYLELIDKSTDVINSYTAKLEKEVYK